MGDGINDDKVVYCDAFMLAAFAEARAALAEGEVPVGCVLVPAEASCPANAGLLDDDNNNNNSNNHEVSLGNFIAARGRNATNKEHHALAHAEFVAVEALLRDAAEKGRKPPASLAGYVLYVVVEPCIMCAAMLLYNRIKKVYFGCCNPRFGGNGTVLAVHAAKSTSAPAYESCGGHRAEEAIALLQEFYSRENSAAPDHKRRRKDI
ncbi:deaminase, putative [Trypanosoma cruzi marinkellei]|uniref:Deaminase, putative n=1 Tax=Trypanosoma cruzi marinkellei TaxID=85056 RepID=K2MLH4_TRYCR|nr:deaminase, putative [Trypanosoma cruzi marinkellei]